MGVDRPMLNYEAKDEVFQSCLLHIRSLSECTISYSNLDLAVLGLSYSFSSWSMINVSKIVINFNTGAFIPATLNLASHKADQLFASCDQQGSNLKLKFEVKLSLLAKTIFLSAD